MKFVIEKAWGGDSYAVEQEVYYGAYIAVFFGTLEECKQYIRDAVSGGANNEN